ncbi:MAG: diguanylate cyclase [Lachnospiraceae bacterium]|nr:diguanylate cyclase [Lachnospiraceae bacterium]
MSAVCIFITVSCYKLDDIPKENLNANRDIILGDEWNCSVGDRDFVYSDLPLLIDNPDNEDIVVTNMIKNAGSNQSFIIFSSHQMFKVFVDDEEIFSFDIPKGSKSKTPGYGWFFIPIKDEYKGKELKIAISTNYKSEKNKLLNIHVGDAWIAHNNLIRDAIKKACLSFIIFILGIFLCIVYIFVGKKIGVEDTIMWLGILSILFALWSLMETGLLGVVYGHPLLMAHISYVTLFTSMIPLLKVINGTLVLSRVKLLEVISFLWGICVCVAIILQLLGICDLRYFTIPCNCVFMISVVIGIGVFIYRIFHYDILKEISYSRYIYVVIIAVFLFADCIRYLFLHANDSAKYGRVGFMLYLIVNGVTLLRNMVMQYKESERFKDIEEVAYHDAMTGCFNRNAFKKDCFNTYNTDIDNVSVIMFDVNNLKYYNDMYGHERGDEYIINCYNIINELFITDENDTLYRIGGDEFCAILRNFSKDEYKERESHIEKMLIEDEDDYIPDITGIASGYAKFNERIDGSISDTIKRADMAMYVRKQMIKSKATGVL